MACSWPSATSPAQPCQSQSTNPQFRFEAIPSSFSHSSSSFPPWFSANAPSPVFGGIASPVGVARELGQSTRQSPTLMPPQSPPGPFEAFHCPQFPHLQQTPPQSPPTYYQELPHLAHTEFNSVGPIGWQCGDGALVPNILRSVDDSLRSGSLLAESLPQCLISPSSASPAFSSALPPLLPLMGAQKGVSGEGVACGGFQVSTEQRGAILMASDKGCLVSNSTSSAESADSEAQLQSRARVSNTQIAGIAHGFKSAWEALIDSVQALSGGWCSHQVGMQTFNGNHLEFRSGCLPDASSWSVRSDPPTAASAQRGGNVSGLAGCHADGMDCPGIFPGVPTARSDAQFVPMGGAVSLQLPAPAVPVFHGRGDIALSMYESQIVLQNSASSLCSLKGNKATNPNQDRALCAVLARGCVSLLAIMDGHGEVGHDVADLCCELLPKLLVRGLSAAAKGQKCGRPFENWNDSTSGCYGDWWKDASCGAFRSVHGFLAACTTEKMTLPGGDAAASAECGAAASGEVRSWTDQAFGRLPPIDARVSGTTATVVMVFPGQRLLVSHVGDSRAVLGVRRKNCRHSGQAWRVCNLTADHKPDLPDECSRIEAAGASVVTVGNPPNTTHRVLSQNQTWPAINMSRSLGDLHAHSQGLTCTPDVSFTGQMWDATGEDAVVIVASDGVWDVISPEVAVEISATAASQGKSPAAVLAKEAYDRWGKRCLQGNYSDDISAVIKFL